VRVDSGLRATVIGLGLPKPGGIVKGLKSFGRKILGRRRIRFTRPGLFFTLGSFAVGFAAFNTGNNPLYLLFGAMLGLIIVSGWLSEQVIRGLSVYRHIPRGVTVGNPVRIHYQLWKRRRRMPSFALEVGERGLPGRGFIPTIPPGGSASTLSRNRFVQRGVFPLEAVRISTSFPFGLFEKSREIPLEGVLVVWPRSDRPVRSPATLGSGNPSAGILSAGSVGVRGEYRGLRTYRPGDDPRDIHWRTTARLGYPVVREYEHSGAEVMWICLDIRGEPGPRAEAAVEIAASLAAQAFQKGQRFGLALPGQVVEAGMGPGQMEKILGALARVDFSLHAPRPAPPVSPARCVLVSLSPNLTHAFGDQYCPPREMAP
jgi:uncharacterized protein (DUF58 family)